MESGNILLRKKDSDRPLHFKGKILVPFAIESALSGVQQPLLPDQNLWYKRYFQKPALVNERLLLHFGAVDWQATIFVNGKEVGQHTGGYQSFSFDITKFLKEGRNELIIKVYDPTNYGIGPHGKQVLNPGNIYYSASSGIWQTVWMEKVPFSYINELFITQNADKGSLTFSADIINLKDNYQIEITAFSGKVLVAKTIGKADALFHLKIASPHLWSPDDPFLYDLSVRLLKDNRMIDEVKSYFGMRYSVGVAPPMTTLYLDG